VKAPDALNDRYCAEPTLADAKRCFRVTRATAGHQVYELAQAPVIKTRSPFLAFSMRNGEMAGRSLPNRIRGGAVSYSGPPGWVLRIPQWRRLVTCWP